MSLQPGTVHWNPAKRIAFRFCFLFFILFVVFFNNGAYPLFDLIMGMPETLMQRFIPWVGRHILHLPYEITVFTNGSGDTTYNYVSLLCLFVVALAGTLVWSVADRRRTNYYNLYYWLLVALRFYVALMLASYGLAKIFKTQFPSPGPARLTQPYGNSSPMGLAWTFLGFSTGYNIFMGLAEVAALLLLFRRTVTIGAIICVMTTANVMAVNYFYDVPVKIVSTSLFLFSLFLLTPNLKPLYELFFRGMPAQLNLMPPPVFTRRWVRYALRGIKVLVFVFVAWGGYESYGAYKEWGDGAPHPPFYGIYNMTAFHRSGPAAGDLRWRKMVIEWEGYAMIRTSKDTTLSYNFKADTVNHIMSLNGEDTTKVYPLHYSKRGENFSMNGMLEGDSIDVTMKYNAPDSTKLMSRGFHWINEYPYNR